MVPSPSARQRNSQRLRLRRRAVRLGRDALCPLRRQHHPPQYQTIILDMGAGADRHQAAAAEELDPLSYMRKYAAVTVDPKVYARHERALLRAATANLRQSPALKSARETAWMPRPRLAPTPADTDASKSPPCAPTTNNGSPNTRVELAWASQALTSAAFVAPSVSSRLSRAAKTSMVEAAASHFHSLPSTIRCNSSCGVSPSAGAPGARAGRQGAPGGGVRGGGAGAAVDGVEQTPADLRGGVGRPRSRSLRLATTEHAGVQTTTLRGTDRRHAGPRRRTRSP